MGAVFANYSDSADRRGGPGREENVGVTLFPSAVPERTRALAKWPIFPPGVYFPPAEGLPGDPLSKNSAFPVSSYLAHTASTLRTMLPAVKARTIVISWKAMAEDPVRHQYHPNNRAELFDFLRASLPAADSARLIEQWAWRYEASPFNPPEG